MIVSDKQWKNYGRLKEQREHIVEQKRIKIIIDVYI